MLSFTMFETFGSPGRNFCKGIKSSPRLYIRQMACNAAPHHYQQHHKLSAVKRKASEDQAGCAYRYGRAPSLIAFSLKFTGLTLKTFLDREKYQTTPCASHNVTRGWVNSLRLPSASWARHMMCCKAQGSVSHQSTAWCLSHLVCMTQWATTYHHMRRCQPSQPLVSHPGLLVLLQICKANVTKLHGKGAKGLGAPYHYCWSPCYLYVNTSYIVYRSPPRGFTGE